MSNIYDIRRYGKIAFLVTAACLVLVFLYTSNNLVKDLSVQERERMEIWADAVKELVNESNSSMLETDVPEMGESEVNDDEAQVAATDTIYADRAPAFEDMPIMMNYDLIISILERNTTIPVLLTNSEGEIYQHHNFDLPDPYNPQDTYAKLSPRNEKFLKDKLAALSHTTNVIDIETGNGDVWHLYYEDSKLLKRLSYYPYVQILLMIVFIAIVYFAVLSTKKAEQNKVWVGLSKETAHQLGTPISSLMAWMELLPDMGVDDETVAEMNKDITRLSTIASRFSKIGSVPQMESANLDTIVRHASDYMSRRISSRINFTVSLATEGDPQNVSDRLMCIDACPPLLEWVMENLIKNAVDAMEGHGNLTVATGIDQDKLYVEVTDSGKGISRKNFKNVFNPGFTTKKRGWGLGLTLAKRIIEQYHHGRIYVKSSTPGVGTTFRIELPHAD